MKRTFDLVLAAVTLLILAPLLLGLAICVLMFLGSPILFRQERTGLRGELFTLYKFRTMNDARDEARALLPDADRLTSFGRFLRRTSLDELPELLNVILGDMSFVGPRPLLPEYLPLYTAEQARRHEVRPGITGWAQVNGRNAISWEEKFRLDVWYVECQSFALDARILAMTIETVIRGRGVSAPDHETMPPFSGKGGVA